MSISNPGLPKSILALRSAQARVLDVVGRENIMPNIQAALDRAKQVYSAQQPVAS